jgi:hypothetical protein
LSKHLSTAFKAAPSHFLAFATISGSIYPARAASSDGTHESCSTVARVPTDAALCLRHCRRVRCQPDNSRAAEITPSTAANQSWTAAFWARSSTASPVACAPQTRGPGGSIRSVGHRSQLLTRSLRTPSPPVGQPARCCRSRLGRFATPEPSQGPQPCTF